MGGRIRFAGTLDGVPVRGTLVPVRGGGHRLYVNGGMRSAAGVGVGDLISVVLSPVGEDEVPLPADVAAGLEEVDGARGAFDALSPSHRRELMRFVDDARSVPGRRKRIARAARHALASSVPGERRTPRGELWQCPRCGHRFVTRNMNHSCRRVDLEDVFRRRPPEIRALFDRFRAMVESCGPVEVIPYRDRVGFMVRVRFAGATPRSRWLDVDFWLTRRLENPRFRRVETLYPNAHIHTFRVEAPEDLDGEVAGWIREAYAVGAREE